MDTLDRNMWVIILVVQSLPYAATLFGTDALAYRLENSQASVVITDEPSLPKILSIRDTLPKLRVIIVTTGDASEGVEVFGDLLSRGSDAFTPVQTRP